MSTALGTERGRARRGWLADAIIAGFVATGASTLTLVAAYLAAAAIGEPRGDFLRVWLWELTHNPVTGFTRNAPAIALGLHMLFGLVWAVLYALFFEPRFNRPGWQEGALFALIPWVLSLVVFMPASGAGILGLGLGAGPLPVLGNLVLHLVYGATLGQLYDRSADAVDTAESAPLAGRVTSPGVAHSESFAAWGIVGGVLVGAVVGVGLALLLPPRTVGESLGGWTTGLILSGALAGAAVGAMVGAFAGLPQAERDPAEAAYGPDSFDSAVMSFLIPVAVMLVLALLIVGIGSFLLMLNKTLAVVAALVATVGVAVVAAWWARRQESRSDREAVSHSGH